MRARRGAAVYGAVLLAAAFMQSVIGGAEVHAAGGGGLRSPGQVVWECRANGANGVRQCRSATPRTLTAGRGSRGGRRTTSRPGSLEDAHPILGRKCVFPYQRRVGGGFKIPTTARGNALFFFPVSGVPVRAPAASTSFPSPARAAMRSTFPPKTLPPIHPPTTPTAIFFGVIRLQSWRMSSNNVPGAGLLAGWRWGWRAGRAEARWC